MNGDIQERSKKSVLFISHLFTGLRPWLLEDREPVGMPGIINLIKGLIDDGFVIKWLVISGSQEERQFRQLPGVKVWIRRTPSIIRLTRRLRPRRYFDAVSFIPLLFWGIIQILRIAKKEEINLIYAEGSRGLPWIGYFAAWTMRTPNVTRMFGTPLAQYLEQSHTRLRMLLIRFLDALSFLAPCHLMIITNDGTRGDRVANIFNAPRKGTLLFLRNGIEKTERKEPCNIVITRLEIPSHSKIVIWVSRFDHWKRVDRVINAMRSVVIRDPDAILLIVGYGETETELKKMSTDLGLENRVLFLGMVPIHQVRDLLACSDVYVSAYDYHANVSNTLFEAMSESCCVVTLKDGSTDKVVTNKVSGFLVDPVDVEGTMGELIGSLLTDLVTRRKAGKRALVVANNLRSWEDRISLEVDELCRLIEH